MKNFFKATVFLWIGGLLGIIQQLLGKIYSPYSLFNLSDIMGSISFWSAFILLLLIRRRKTPKEHFRDVFLLFLGLDFFYYIYIFAMDIYYYLSYNQSVHSNEKEFSYFFQNTLSEIPDFIKWTLIGLAAAILGYFALTSRDKEKKKLYFILIAPFFIVFIFMAAGSIANAVNYVMQEITPVNEREEGVRYTMSVAGIMTDIFSAGICSYLYAKLRPWNYPSPANNDPETV